jgi:hypothetical protein
MPKSFVEKEAIRIVENHLSQQGWDVENIQESGPGDLRISKKGVEPLTVEIKGTAGRQSIPDFYGTEVEEGHLKADLLYVVYFPKKDEDKGNDKDNLMIDDRQIYEIKPEEIDGQFKHKEGWRVKKSFKRKLGNEIRSIV